MERICFILSKDSAGRRAEDKRAEQWEGRAEAGQRKEQLSKKLNGLCCLRDEVPNIRTSVSLISF